MWTTTDYKNCLQLLSQGYKFVKFSFNQLFSTLYKVTWLFLILKKFPSLVSVINLVIERKRQLWTLQRRFSLETKNNHKIVLCAIIQPRLHQIKGVHLLKLQISDLVTTEGCYNAINRDKDFRDVTLARGGSLHLTGRKLYKDWVDVTSARLDNLRVRRPKSYNRTRLY